LLVEDDSHVRNALRLMLEFDGHTVEATDGASSALGVLEQRTFDLIITDYWMPQMNGDELAVIIKQRWPGQRILMTSGSLANQSNLGDIVAGVDCLLNKPFTLMELREAIAWALEPHSEVPQDETSAGKPGLDVAPPPSSQEFGQEENGRRINP
jgi:CheY-like chemotaxis protein